jgi:hypothetical protein
MIKFVFGITVGIILAFVGFFVKNSFSSRETISKDLARVTVKNESGRTVKRITLQHNNGTLEASPLSSKEEVRFVFNNAGENVYKILATFDDGSTLASQGVYFEYGYRGIETIKTTEIVTEHDHYEILDSN